jgi:hypothetical protein
VFGGLNRLLLATIVAGGVLTVVLAGPAAAASCGGGTSAVAVYKECQQNGGGGKSAGHSSTGSAGTHTGTSTNPGSSSTPDRFSAATRKALNEAGKDKAALAALVKTNGLRRHIASQGPATSPTAVGSAFDLSSGPTALLIVLAGTALLLVAGSGMRVWRTRRRV